MSTHIVRWLAATLNLLLGGLLTALWVTNGGGGMTNDWIGWIFLISLVVATVSSVGAGVLLTRRRTMATGLQWHGIVAWCLGTFLVAGILESFTQASRYAHAVDWIPYLVMLAVILVWPALSASLGGGSRRNGLNVRRFRKRRNLNALNDTAQPIASVPLKVRAEKDEPVILHNRL